MKRILIAALLIASVAVCAADKTKIVLVAGRPSHDYGSHEHNAGCLLLAKCLNENMPNVEAVVYQSGWPADPKAFENAKAVIMYCDGGGGHVAIPRLKEINEWVKKGVGIGCIHYGVEVPAGEPGYAFLRWIGGYFETYWSVNPHWTADFKEIPKHEITRGVKPFSTNDEWYYHMRFRENEKGVIPILTAVPPDSTRSTNDSTHGGNEFVRARKGVPEHVVWAYERPDGGRGFGCTGGHVHWNWAQDDYRKCILNAICWIAKVEVPENGVSSKRPTIDEMMANLDKKQPPNFDKTKIEKKIEDFNKPK